MGFPLRALLLLWLAGVALRLTILSVPPVIPFIHDDLHLTETQIGLLSGLPMALFAGAAIAGSLLIARLGALTTLVLGLLLCAAGSALRGVGPSLPMLYAMTFVMGFGISVMQPALPPLVLAWAPRHIGLATAVYTNGLIVGEILPAALTIPLLLPAIGPSWRLTFVFWAVPVLVIAFIIMALVPRGAASHGGPAASRRWMPDFRNPLIWRIGLLLGSVNASYFALNLGQLPASFLLLASAERMVRTAWSYAVCGVVCFLSVLMIVFAGGVWVIVGCALIGCFAAAILVLVLALPPLMSAPDEVHLMAAGIFTISYSCAVIVPILSGVGWDLTGVPAIAMVPVGICALIIVGLAPSVVLREKSTF